MTARGPSLAIRTVSRAPAASASPALIATGSLLVLATLALLATPAVGTVEAVTVTDLTDNPRWVFPDGTQLKISASNGATTGGTRTAQVQDTVGLDQINVTVRDDGTGADPVASDTFYFGTFTIVSDGGVSGTNTNDGTDTLDLADGSRAIARVDLDAGADSGTDDFKADWTRPAVAITSPASVVNGPYTLRATVSDASNLTVTYRVDSGSSSAMTEVTPGTFEATPNLGGLPEGPHVLRVNGSDEAGNWRDANLTVTVDKTDPVVSIISASGVLRGTYQLQVNASDTNLDSAAVTYTLDGGGAVALAGPGPTFTAAIDTDPLTEGSHLIQVAAADLAGNTNNQKQVSISVDRTKPVLTVESAAGRFAGDYPLSVRMVETNPSVITWAIDGGPPQVFTTSLGEVRGATVNRSGLADGPHTIAVQATDLAGNVADQVTLSVTSDQSGPALTVVSIAGIAGPSWNLTTRSSDVLGTVAWVRFAWDAADPAAGTDLPLVDAGTGTYALDVDTRLILDGPHTLTVASGDDLGSVTIASALALTVDHTKPVLRLEVADGQAFDDPSTVIIATADDPTTGLSRFRLLLETSELASETTFANAKSVRWTPSVTWPTEGDLNLTAEATDLAGNVASVTVVITVGIAPAPVTGLRVLDAKDGKVNLTWTGSPATDLAAYHVYQSKANFSDVGGMTRIDETNATSFTVAGLINDQTYYFAVTPVDTFGNEATKVVPVDATPKLTEVNGSEKKPRIELVRAAADDTSLAEGETLTVTVDVRNVGAGAGKDVSVRLLVDGKQVDQKLRDIAPGASETVTLKWTARPGTHTVTVDSIVGGTSAGNLTVAGNKGTTFDVKAKVVTIPGPTVGGIPVLLIAIPLAVVIAAVGAMASRRKRTRVAKEQEELRKRLQTEADAKAETDARAMEAKAAEMQKQFTAMPKVERREDAGTAEGATQEREYDDSGPWSAFAVWKVPVGQEPNQGIRADLADKALAAGPLPLPPAEWEGPEQPGPFEVHVDFARSVARMKQQQVYRGGKWVDEGTPSGSPWSDVRREHLQPADGASARAWTSAEIGAAVDQMKRNLG